MKKVKVVVIGGGIAGYTAAIRASQLGAEVTLIERNRLGGVCLNEGCIPTKKILYHAKLYSESKSMGAKFDLSEVIKKTENILKNMRNGMDLLLSRNKVRVINGEAGISSENEIKVTEKNSNKEMRIDYDYLIIAIGSKPSTPKNLGRGVFSSQDILKIREIPKNLGIIGAGYIGLEFASLFAMLGSKVTIFEKEGYILPFLDKEIVKELLYQLSKKDISIKTNQYIEDVAENSIKTSEGTLNFDTIIACMGRETLEIESKVNLEKERGYIKVNDSFQTSVKNIYAIGDCIGRGMLAYTASRQAELVTESLLANKKEEMEKMITPYCIFTSPEVSGIGSLESDNSISARIPFSVNSRANCEESNEGFLKIVADKDKRITGVHIIHPHASELIAPFIIAVCNNLTAEELSSCIYPHPTLGEIIKEAADFLNNKSINFFSKKNS